MLDHTGIMAHKHSYVSLCEEDLANAGLDPLSNAPHLRALLKYLSESSSQWPLGPYAEDPPFAWSYTCPETGALQLSPNSRSKDFDPVRKTGREREESELLFLNGQPSSAWLNTIGYKYNVDMKFFQQHLRSIRPSVHDTYAKPSLPSSSRHTLKLSIPTVGDLFNTNDLVGDLSTARSLLAENLEAQFLKNVQNSPVGQPIVRNACLHNLKQLTLFQEVSMCLLQENGAWTIIIWTDAGGEDKDPDLSFLFNQTHRKPRIEFCPTAFNRSKWHDAPASSPTTSSNTRFKATQTFNSLHKIYGESLNPGKMRNYPFYAVSEIYALAAAAENQFLNMMKEILDERMKFIVKEGLQTKSSPPNDLSESINLHHDRSILEERFNCISDIVTFLKAANDSVWFHPYAEHTSKETMTAQMSLLQDFQYLQTQVLQLVQHCERAMHIVAHNASLSEAKRSNSQSENLEQLARLTTGLTLVYVPLSFVCTFFGMNFSIFGQGELPIWIFAAVCAPVLLTSFFLFAWKWASNSKKESSQKQ